MTINRRTLLASGLAAGAMATSATAYAAATDARLLVVFLRGAYDAANIVIPVGSDLYYQARPTLAIAKPDDAVLTSALRLDADWGLHPGLRDSIMPFWTKGQLALVPFAGSVEDKTRSHFDTQMGIELGQSLQGSRQYNSGFLARLAAVLGNSSSAISFTNSTPLIFRRSGNGSTTSIAVRSIGKPGFSMEQEQIIADMYETPLAKSIAPYVVEGFAQKRAVFEESMRANGTAASSSSFEETAVTMANLMRGTYRVAFADFGGWDTHVNQGSVDGVLASNMAMLGRGLAAFAKQMDAYWDKTTVVVISEFGRTFFENGSKGTDHGRGSAYWVMGGGVKGGRMVGNQVKLTLDTLDSKRDMPVLNDYRSLLGGLFMNMYGLSASQLDTVFPGASPANLGLV